MGDFLTMGIGVGIWQYLETFNSDNYVGFGGGQAAASDTLWPEAHRAAKQPTVHQTALHNKVPSGPALSSATIGGSYFEALDETKIPQNVCGIEFTNVLCKYVDTYMRRIFQFKKCNSSLTWVWCRQRSKAKVKGSW